MSGSARHARTTASLSFAATVLVLAATATGLLAARGASRLELVAPLAAVAALALVALGCYRFEWFVLCVLAVRTALDATRASAGENQLASTVRAAPDAVSSGPAASALAVLFIAMSGMWLIAQHRGGVRHALSVADAAFALFVTACVLSSLGSVSPTASFAETARIVAAILMFVVLERLLTSAERVRRVLVACFVALVVSTIRGVLQAVSGSGRFVTDGVSRVVGTFLHPNTFGFFVAMFILMSVALFPHCAGRVRIALAAAVAVGSLMLLLSYSRGAWLALVAGLVVIGVVQSRRVFGWLVGGAVAVLLFSPAAVGRITNLTSTQSSAGDSGNSLLWRVDYWTSVSKLNHDNPVTGIGLKGTKLLENASKPPHNDFLRAYAETGVLGLLGFVLVIVVFVAIARRALRAGGTGVPRGVAVGFAAVVTAYIVDSLGANLLSEVVVLWYFYAFAACAVAVPRIVAASSARTAVPAAASVPTIASVPAASVPTTASVPAAASPGAPAVLIGPTA